MYKEIITQHQTSTLLLLTLSPLVFFKVATVEGFSLTARIDELLLTGIRVEYWSEDKTLQITEKTLPHCLLRHVLWQCIVYLNLKPDRNVNPLDYEPITLCRIMPRLVGHIGLISYFLAIMCECRFGKEWLVNVEILNLFMIVVSCRGS